MSLRSIAARVVPMIVWPLLSAGLGRSAELPSQRTLPLSAPSGWLNVLDCGVSGSKFETKATTTAGSKEIMVEAAGDFKAGQGITVSRCNLRVVSPTIYGPKSFFGTAQPLKDALEIRGYDGSAGSWLVFVLEIQSADPPAFRWSDDLVHNDRFTANNVPITGDWQKLSNGVEIKFNKRDWQPGHVISFTCRDQLATVVEKVEGRKLTLRDAPRRTTADAVARHDDSLAIQAAVDRAVKERRNLFFPAGWYRVSRTIRVKTEAICLEGANGTDTVMDITDGAGSVFDLDGCTEATVRNFKLVGHTGMAEAAGAFTSSTGFRVWACEWKGCGAVRMTTCERVLIENVHASRMASECFYASGTNRQSNMEQPRYQKLLTYLRCSVTDCAANAFNNNDMGENTSVLYCRIDGAGWHATEMPARFQRLIGNYVRNAGPFTVGDQNHRYDDLHNLGCGQAIVADNVFEGMGKCGGIAIYHGPSQVAVTNNLFINFNGPAITASSLTTRSSFPSRSVTIAGNIIDLTCRGAKPVPRTGITVSSSDTIVSDNQIYVRGPCDERVTGIQVAEPALNVSVHDNLIQNCNRGILTLRADSRVSQVIDSTTFLEDGLPLEGKGSHGYRGWNLVWLTGSNRKKASVIDSFDWETLRFKLKEPAAMNVGDTFQVFPAGPANWNMHHNTITGCLEPVTLDSYGSEASAFSDNMISCGGVQGVKHAVYVHGQFQLVGNQISGFDEPDSAALWIVPGPFGQPTRNVYQRNVLTRCTTAVREFAEESWEKCIASDNLFIDCKTAPKTGGAVLRREQGAPAQPPKAER